MSFSCASQPSIASENENGLPTPTPIPSITKNEKGEYIKPTGWYLPVAPEHQKFKASFWQVDGRKIKILSSFYMPKSKVTIKEPFEARGSDYVGELFDVTEFKTEGKRPFCYRIATSRKMEEGVNGTGALIVFNIRDVDGDGVFETLGGGCPIPDWAK